MGNLLMKTSRVLLLLAITLSLLAGVVMLSRRSTPRGATKPEECLDDYYESLQSGDMDKYRRCLDEALRVRVDQRAFDAACREVKEVKNLVQIAGPAESETSRWVDVDEVRAAGIRRLRYHLRRDNGNWVIASIDPPRETSAPIRYGTPVGDEP
jgi:hypothetical protein